MLLTCDKDVHVTTALVWCWIEDFTNSKPTDITDSNVLGFAGDEAVRQWYTAWQISIVLKKSNEFTMPVISDADMKEQEIAGTVRQ